MNDGGGDAPTQGEERRTGVCKGSVISWGIRAAAECLDRLMIVVRGVFLCWVLYFSFDGDGS